MINLIELESVASTNTYASEHLPELPHGTLLLARAQTAGRGQRGNSWESEPGRNVSMSLVLKELPVGPRRQFAVSEATALAVADTIARITCRDDISVKWPNDIYAADRKICGILIECGISGTSMTHAILGIGINVNQTVFLSDAPNPVSVAQLTGRDDHDITAIALEVAQRIEESLATPFDAESLHLRYLSRLWRREGVYHWRRRSDGLAFSASIASVSPDGYLTLLPAGKRDSSPLPPFAFKEVEALL